MNKLIFKCKISLYMQILLVESYKLEFVKWICIGTYFEINKKKTFSINNF